MTNYTIDASITRETSHVTAVTVRTADGGYLGGWTEPYSDVTAEHLSDKDKVRELVSLIRSTRFHIS